MMKKTALSLIISALVSNVALAEETQGEALPLSSHIGTTEGIELFRNDNTSMKVHGEMRVQADIVNGSNPRLYDNDSRIGFSVKQQGDNGWFGEGYFEVGMRNLTTEAEVNSTDMYGRQYVVGVGKEGAGTLTFGRQLSPADWAVGKHDKSYAYGGSAKMLSNVLGTDIVDNAAVYTYKSDSFELGAQYQFERKEDSMSFSYGNSHRLANDENIDVTVNHGYVLGGKWNSDVNGQ